VIRLKVYGGSRLIAAKIRPADTFFTRFIGLMGKKCLGPGDGLLLMSCPSIHCFFMKMTIDAVYLSGDMTVLYVETIPPWHLGRHVKHTANILELAPGTALVSPGDNLTVVQ
jgi:uncharacterized protein